MTFRISTLTLLAISGVILLSSCAKKHHCDCVTETNIYGSRDTLISSYDILDNESKARELCEGKTHTIDTTGIYQKQVCTLK